MASDWIKMRANLRSDPAVVSIARALRLDVDAVVGKLHAVWSWADGVTEDGLVDGVDAELVDEIARRKGFAAAMAATPRSAWLIIRGNGVEFPRFDRHNGKSAKRRALDAERKRLDRDPVSARPPTRVRDPSASNADMPRTKSGPEKRREEKTTGDETERREQLPAAGAAGPPEPRPRRVPSAPHQELIAWFEGEYERLRGSPYVVNGSKDGPAVSRALKRFEPAELRARLARGLQLDDDGFIASSDRGLAFLLGQINRPSLRGLATAGPSGRPTVRSQIETIAAVGRRLAEEETQREQH